MKNISIQVGQVKVGQDNLEKLTKFQKGLDLKLIPKVEQNLNKLESGNVRKRILKRESNMHFDYTNKHAMTGGES